MALSSLIWLFCESVLYGMYLVLFVGCMYMLIMKRGRTAANSAMIAVSVVMFLLSSAHVALTLVSFIISEQGATSEDGAPNNPRQVAQFAMEGANYIIGDSVVIWRLWAVWNRDARVCIAPVSILLAAAGSAIGGVYMMSRVGPIDPNDFGTTPMAKWGFAFIILTLSTNVCATGLIAWRSHFYYRRLSPDVQLYTSTSKRILVLLVESGAVYCATWVAAAVLWAADSLDWLAVTGCLSQLTGIYPTVIIVLVSVNMTIESIHTHPALSSSHVPTPLSTGGIGRRSLQPGGRRKRDSGLVIRVDTHTSSQRSYDVEEGYLPRLALDVQRSRISPKATEDLKLDDMAR